MFKKENIVWLYFIGILIMMVVVIYSGKEYFIPVILGTRDTNIETGFVYSDPPKTTINRDLDYRADMVTLKGTITIDLFEKAAPINVNNFVFLSQQNYYNGTYFHRLIPSLFIQGGDRNTINDDPSDDGFGGPGYIVKDEINWDTNAFDEAKRQELTAAGYKSTEGLYSRPIRKYSVIMASSGPDTNGGQFCIILADDDDPRLYEMAGRFTVIGEVIFGKENLIKLANTEIDARNPLVPRPIRKLTISDINIYTHNPQ